jgi:predicted nuclease with TOPRIM domain
MPGEQALGDDLDEWLTARADELGTDRERLLARLVAGHRLALAEAGGGELQGLPTAVADLRTRVSAVEDDLDAKIADVRERVVQVKRETDTKAPADHGHPELADRLDTLATETDTLRQEYDDLRDDHEALRADLAAGFENYELVLDDLDADTADLAEKADTLARVALGLRDRIDSLEGESATRRAVATLQREANRLGVSSATCDDCGSSVHVGLLGAPTCPHCEATFDGVESARGFFGSPTLTTGERPALTDGPDAGSDDGDAAARTADDLFAEDDHD